MARQMLPCSLIHIAVVLIINIINVLLLLCIASHVSVCLSVCKCIPCVFVCMFVLHSISSPADMPFHLFLYNTAVSLLYRETQSVPYGSTISVPGPITACPLIPVVCWTSWRKSNWSKRAFWRQDLSWCTAGKAALRHYHMGLSFCLVSHPSVILCTQYS